MAIDHAAGPQMLEFLEDRLYLTAFSRPPPPDFLPHLYFFTVDDALIYNPFFHDFGPLNISHLFRFSLLLHEVLSDPEVHKERPVVFYSKKDAKSRANAACLLACYMVQQMHAQTISDLDLQVLVQQWPPHLVLAPLCNAEPPFLPFRDAGYAPADYSLTIQDAVYGVWRAREAGILEIRDLDVNEYETYERVENGDFNWVSPHFVAFASPSQSGYTHNRSMPLNSELPPAFDSVLRYFCRNNVKLVVRLNSALYDARRFTQEGIEHQEMFFEDGTVPSLEIVREFIDCVDDVLSKDEKAVIAVHCKAGLGRTGCLIGAFLIYRYAFTANEVMAYMRILRPGMVVGPQQHWLHINQQHFRGWYYEKLYAKQSVKVTQTLSPTHKAIDQTITVSTPTRSPLSEMRRSRTAAVDNTPLPAPTPGQPRKASTSVGKDYEKSERSRSVRAISQKLWDGVDEGKSVSDDSEGPVGDENLSIVLGEGLEEHRDSVSRRSSSQLNKLHERPESKSSETLASPGKRPNHRSSSAAGSITNQLGYQRKPPSSRSVSSTVASGRVTKSRQSSRKMV